MKAFKCLLSFALILSTFTQIANAQNSSEDWSVNSPSQDLTEEHWERGHYNGIINTYLKGRTHLIAVDTRDRESCLLAKQEILRDSSIHPNQDLISMCDYVRETPWVTVSIVTPGETREEYQREISVPKEGITRDTINLSAMMIGGMGVLWLLPESTTNWKKSEIKSRGLGNKWKNNVRKGPVIDKDNWAINWIGHPISGSAYYVVARSNGATLWEGFGYSVLMSTFFWEYGFEALAEIPSTQDLIITPVLGSLLGEIFYQQIQNIEKNDGKVFGSKALGNASIWLMNPAGKLSEKINLALDRPFIKNSKTQMVVGSKKNQNGFRSDYIEFKVQFKF
jgi:hypothetical protein